jgi:hypothetical protein
MKRLRAQEEISEQCQYVIMATTKQGEDVKCFIQKPIDRVNKTNKARIEFMSQSKIRLLIRSFSNLTIMLNSRRFEMRL